MALRKFSKHMKVVTVIVILAFLFTSAYAGYSYFVGVFTNRKQVLLKIDGYDIYKKDYEQTLQSFTQKVEGFYKSQEANNKDFTKIPDNYLKQLALGTVINKTLFNELSDNLKVSISRSQVNDELAKYEKQYGGEDKLALILAQNGSNITVLKENIRQSLRLQYTVEALEKKYEPSEQMLKDYYNIYSTSLFKGMKYEDNIDKIKKSYFSEINDLIISSNLSTLFANAKIETKDENIKALVAQLQKPVISKDGYVVTELDLVSQYVSKALANPNGFTQDLVDTVNKSIDAKINADEKIVDAAQKVGLKPIEGLNKVNEAAYLTLQYLYYLAKTYNPTDEKMQSWYNLNKQSYAIPASISGRVFGIQYPKNEQAFENAKSEAEKLMKTLNNDNFAKMAQQYSKDPGSAKNGGDLGWNDIRKFVPEFAQCAEHKVGEIFGPIKTAYGYHIVQLLGKDEKDPNKLHLRHILITPYLTEQQKMTYNKMVDTAVNDVKSGKITWDNMAKDKAYSMFDINVPFNNLLLNQALPVIGYNKDLQEKVLNASVNTYVPYQNDELYVVVYKSAEVKAKQLSFDEVKQAIRNQLAIMYAANEIANFNK